MTNEELEKLVEIARDLEEILLASRSEIVLKAVTEIERLQKAFKETENVTKQLAEAYKWEADRYESESNKFSPLVQFTRGRQDAYENVLRILAQVLKGE